MSISFCACLLAFVFTIILDFLFGQVNFPHHSHPFSEGSHISRILLPWLQLSKDLLTEQVTDKVIYSAVLEVDSKNSYPHYFCVFYVDSINE